MLWTYRMFSCICLRIRAFFLFTNVNHSDIRNSSCSLSAPEIHSHENLQDVSWASKMFSELSAYDFKEIDIPGNPSLMWNTDRWSFENGNMWLLHIYTVTYLSPWQILVSSPVWQHDDQFVSAPFLKPLIHSGCNYQPPCWPKKMKKSKKQGQT